MRKSSYVHDHPQAALSIGADSFIRKGETPERAAEHSRSVAASVSIQ